MFLDYLESYAFGEKILITEGKTDEELSNLEFSIKWLKEHLYAISVYY